MRRALRTFEKTDALMEAREKAITEAERAKRLMDTQAHSRATHRARKATHGILARGFAGSVAAPAEQGGGVDFPGRVRPASEG